MSENENAEPVAEPVKKPGLLHNYLSFVGIAIVVASLVSIMLLVLLELTDRPENPYTVLVTYILLPGILVFGLFLVLVGAWWERRRRRKNPDAGMTRFPVLDLNNAGSRRSFIIFITLAIVFLFISAFGSYRAFEYTESVTFCGQQCHTVMKPEFVAYNASPHSQVACVECHVGGGAEWYVRSKLNGMHQLYSVTFHTYNKPIQTPVHNMRPANDTCVKCHWAQMFHGETLKVFNHYSYDEKNSLNQTRLLLKTGGGDPNLGQTGGIHWHMNLANEVTYVAADEKRQTIPWVRFKDGSGNVVEYTAKWSQSSPQQIEQADKRRMDCIDCHNRPTHIYLSPSDAVDQSLASAKLDATLPFIKLKAVETLSKEYETTDQAVAQIATDLNDYYRNAYPDIYNGRQDLINHTVEEVQRIYQTYFFPEMKTDWRAHINNIGHYNAQGCFRCHDGQHFSPEGKVIRNECGICHTALDQTFAGKSFVPAGNIFQHPVNLGDRNTWQCAACHKADRPFKHPVNLGDISKFQCADCHKGQSL